MSLQPLTTSQLEQWNQNRCPALYGSLIALLIVNNVVTSARFFAHWRTHYQHSFSFKNIFAEDYFILLGALCIDAVIGNLLASTHYGLGLHSWRINAEDENYPRNLSNVFKHVWITMILTGLTFSSIKLSLLFFYRRLFLVNQRWLAIAWWVNIVYVVLWCVGATGFYVFQCWPVQWYFMRYYHKYGVQPPYPIHGQCNATTTTHVAIPLIFGMFSDVMILVLPLATIFRLQISTKGKIGLSFVFSVGTIACLLDLSRIIELGVDTDDKVDPSYGVVMFLILSAATEVAAIMCASLPIIGPQILREYKRYYHQHPYKSKPNSSTHRSHPSEGFEQLGECRVVIDSSGEQIALGKTDSPSYPNIPGGGRIWVESDVEVTVEYDHGYGHKAHAT